MNLEIKQVGKKFLGQWILATSIGWLIGSFVGFALASIIIEDVIGSGVLGEILGYFMFGAGLGAGVGYSQWHIIHKYFKISAWWIWASAIGIGLPFVIDVLLVELVGVEYELKNDILDQLITGVICGLLIGLLQINVVKSLSKKGIWWIVISPLAWGISWLSREIADVVGFFIIGGVVLGAITGIAILWLLQFPVQGDIDKAEPSKTSSTI